MPRTAPGRFGVFSDEELVEAEKRSHVRFLRRLGIGPAANGRFDDINNKELRRRVARSFAEMSDREFDEAWQLGHIGFLGHAWGAQSDYFRRLRTQPYKAGTGWQRPGPVEEPVTAASAPAVPDLGPISDQLRKTGSSEEKVRALEAINSLLSPPAQLPGVFLPPRHEPRFEFVILGEMPSMNEPPGVPPNVNFNFNVTAGDRFLQQMMVKYGLAGSYITDIVKQRAAPGRPSPIAIKTWLPFLRRELEIIEPRGLIVLGRTSYLINFRPFVESSLPAELAVDWVFHYSQVPRARFEARFAEVCTRMRDVRSSHR